MAYSHAEIVREVLRDNEKAKVDFLKRRDGLRSSLIGLQPNAPVSMLPWKRRSEARPRKYPGYANWDTA